MFFRQPKLILVTLLFSTFSLGCNKSGTVNFREGKSRSARPAPSFNLVPGSQALATSSEGYKAKLEINPVKGQTLQSTSGYSLRLTNTTGK